ncbi:hypothetical protein NPIL_198321 [Nephila pilipes]|uniref:Uncharacterized protein n=1 Tax=Nephila pilipes TaxID=299642 RepID=A0A8X6U597_NEPPI|nr:hypothetical protein NPIL_198321 [Nephila pilipes]
MSRRISFLTFLLCPPEPASPERLPPLLIPFLLIGKNRDIPTTDLLNTNKLSEPDTAGLTPLSGATFESHLEGPKSTCLCDTSGLFCDKADNPFYTCVAGV